MAQTTSFNTTNPAPSGVDTGRFIGAVAALIATLIGLLLGFVILSNPDTYLSFISDSAIQRIVLAIFAVIWGVGGVAVLFITANWAVESLSIKWTARIQPWVFVGPALILLFLFLFVPTIITLVHSFQDRDGQGFVGLDNYSALLTQRDMREAWGNNLLWLGIGTTLIVVLGLLIAVLADRSKFENIAKSLIFLPLAISMVGAGVIWKFVYDVNPNIGMVNAVVTSGGGTNQDWLRLVQPWNNLLLIMVMVWLQTGYAMVLISAAIKAVPDDLLEAARIDGAGEIRIFFRIIIPNISAALIAVTTTVVIFTLKIFDIVWVMTGGQFGTDVIGVRFYRELFTIGNKGVGSAIAIILFIVVIPIMIYNLREFSKRETI